MKYENDNYMFDIITIFDFNVCFGNKTDYNVYCHR